MKKLFFALAAILTLGCCCAFAADSDVYDKIEKANAGKTAMQGHFDHSRLIKASGKTVKMEGILYYTAPDKLGMHYTTPRGDKLVINGRNLFLHNSQYADGRLFDTGSNPLMAGLSGTLLNCIKGKVRTVAADNDAALSLKDDGRNYIVSMTANKKSSRGYSKITITYRKKDCLLVKMVTESDAGVVNTYDVSDILTSVTNKPEVFAPRR